MKNDVIGTLKELGFEQVEDNKFKCGNYTILLKYRELFIYNECDVLLVVFLRFKEKFLWKPYVEKLIKEGEESAENDLTTRLDQLNSLYGVEKDED